MDLQSLYNKIMDLLDQERAFIDCNEMKIYKIYKIYEDGAYIEGLSFKLCIKKLKTKG